MTDSVAKILVENRPPANLAADDEMTFKRDYKYEVGPPGTTLLRNCLVSPDGLIYEYLKPLAESINPCFDQKRYSVRVLLRGIMRYGVRLKYDDDIVYGVGFDRWSDNYFHWMTETLPRLLTLKERHAEITILLPEELRTTSVEVALNLLGFNKITWMAPRSFLFAKHVVVAHYTSPAGRYNPNLLLSTRRMLMKQSRLQPMSNGVRLYISREKSRGRRVVNEEEVVSYLTSRGFVAARMEDLDLLEQIRAMGNVEYLISAHGAGLTNMMFMHRPGFVMEFRRKGDAHNNCYFTLASVLGHSYFFQFSETRANGAVGQGVHFEDLYVDMDQLRVNVDLMLMARD